VISGILAGGIPGFRIELCCFLHPPKWPIVILGLVLLLFILWACVNMAHKMSLCMFRDDTKLSPPAFMDLFTHKLVLVMSPLFGVCGFWLFVSGFVCCFVSWCFAGFS